jgi:hypothetical protein
VRTTMGWLYFLAVQLVALALFPVGIVVVGVLAATRSWTFDINTQRYHWLGKWAWIFDNDEDGIFSGPPSLERHPRWNAFVWCALRNSVNNLRFLTAWKGGPWLQIRRSGRYFQAGFRPDTGWPVLSAGRGTGTVL